MHDHSYIATDYHEELSHWQDDDYSDKEERIMQLPFIQVRKSITFQGINYCFIDIRTYFPAHSTQWPFW